MRSSSNCHYCHYCYPDYYNQYTYSIFYLQSFLFYYVQLTTHDHTSQLVPLANGLRLLTRSRQSIIIARSVYAIYPYYHYYYHYYHYYYHYYNYYYYYCHRMNQR